jgi:hypothetical protein
MICEHILQLSVQRFIVGIDQRHIGLLESVPMNAEGELR